MINPNTPKLRIGVMGCANVARQHFIPAIKELPEKFSLVAVAGRSSEKAKSYAEAFHCDAITGYQALLDRDDIDVIYCPLPTGLHSEWINKALLSGKHVYAEKSLGLSLLEVKEMIQNAQERDLALMEGYMYKYHPQHQKVKELLKAGKIGEIRHFRSAFCFPPLPDKRNFRYDEQIGGGAIMDAGGYAISAVEFITGKRLKVGVASVFRNQNGTSIYGSAFLNYDNEFTADVVYGFDNYYQCRYEILGTIGKITVPKAFTPKKEETTKIILETKDGETMFDIPPCNHFVKALEELYDMCHEERKREYQYEINEFQSYLLEQMIIKSK